MPARSKAQKRLMTWALGVKKGKAKTTSKKIKDVAKSMSVEELEKYTKTKGTMPEKVKKNNESASIINFENFKTDGVIINNILLENEEEETMEMGGIEAPENAEEGDDILMNIKAPGHVTPEKGSHSYEWSEPEYKMIQFQIKNIIEKAEEILQLIDGKESIEDWVQAKMTVADNYISNVRDYMKHKI